MANNRQPQGVPLISLAMPPPIYTNSPTSAASAAGEPSGFSGPLRLSVPAGPYGPPGAPTTSASTTASTATPSDPGSNRSKRSNNTTSSPVPSEEELCTKFRDFDDRHVYEHAVAHALDEHALNFVVQFGDNKAQVACDLNEGDFKQLLSQPNMNHANPDDSSTPIRWINIWNPSRQQGVIEAIGARYNFSKRLTMSIWAWDLVKTELIRRKLIRREELLHPYRAKGTGTNVAVPLAAATISVVDLEGGKLALRNSGINLPDTAAATLLDGDLEDVYAPENLATFKIMQDNLNYTSIDQETRFVCIGANWLHSRPQYSTKTTPSLVPPKHWSWFVMCEDNTVISFHEAAYYDDIPKSQDQAAWRTAELRNMRSNTLKVLRQLSLCGLREDQHKFTQLTSVRQPGSRPLGDAHNLEVSSNLFYYLFEDYSAAFDILGSSKAALDDISGRVLRTADWRNKEDTSNIIPMLYKLNKELRQLHHLFTNYKNVIDRLISSEVKMSDDGTAIKEKLSIKAANRFKRLQVQMQSLMLDAIKDYLDEKTSLQDTYFSLITQKDSQSTERLTRSATLLAKLSVFFLPISFMTSYFSVQIPHMTDNYTAWTYWGAFAVIAGVSFMSLFFFSKVLMFVSERLDRWADKSILWISNRVGWARRKRMRAMKAEESIYR